MPESQECDLAPADALRDGELKAFPAADTQVLLVRRGGQPVDWQELLRAAQAR
ncbi:hypothetical protein [Hymenobacter sp. CRA2]|uniref:hypothetical protein n=1 Tax=Hymenobacter sp. CRA2 TaxID=1955620 RepID=UPI00158F9E1A|nr:hypothetical protein [Hymenobacter sp. CRA2]